MSPSIRVSVRRGLYGALAADGGVGGLVYQEGQPGGLLGPAAPSYTHSIYYGNAPDGAGFPYVIFSKTSSTPVHTFRGQSGPNPGVVGSSWGTIPPYPGSSPDNPAWNWTANSQRGDRHAIADSEIWQVKAVTHATTADTADDIAGRLETVLTDYPIPATGSQSGTTTAPYIAHLYLRPESGFSYSETLEGETYHHAGSDFRLIYSATF